MSTTKWDKAISELTHVVWIEAPLTIKDELTKRLVPLLDAVANLQPHIWEDSFLSKDCEHTNYTRSVVALREELTKWLK